MSPGDQLLGCFCVLFFGGGRWGFGLALVVFFSSV